MKIVCSFKFELLANDDQRSALSRNAGCRRFVFNKALELQNERKAKGEKLLNYCEMAAELVRWKKADETAFLKEAMSQPLQQTLRDLDRAIRDSFRPQNDAARKGWPKFKVKDIGDGFRIPQFKTADIDEAAENRLDSIPQDAARRIQERGRVADIRHGEADSRQQGLRPVVRRVHGGIRRRSPGDESA